MCSNPIHHPTDPITKIQIDKGQEVVCLQASSENRGYVLVEFDSLSLDVPFQFFEPFPAVLQPNDALNI